MASLTKFIVYAANTGNSAKISIALEALKAAYPDANLSYEVKFVDLSKKEQKAPEYVKLNPNGRVPTLVDRSRNDFIVFESSAILIYLLQHYDPEYKLSFNPVTDPDAYSQMLQWIFFVHGGFFPMQGQGAVHCSSVDPDQELSRKRYFDETNRVYGILDKRLEGRKWVVGPGEGVYTVADIVALAGIKLHKMARVNLDEYPNAKAWLERWLEKETVTAGYAALAR
ncbi:glutathione S-transferase [Fistulina hepatica ATCC 64428]|uniref:Glutathione S-transferase n=1 Tax=Fistulina hepatica ATCC 64428 TaxID=1128425 RepID=A0A0D7AJ52_9AGAR|nr:glutathione S-transferase [Fistulina hepatica ATCC 64428]